jgi:hypothetical protein
VRQFLAEKLRTEDSFVVRASRLHRPTLEPENYAGETSAPQMSDFDGSPIHWGVNRLGLNEVENTVRSWLRHRHIGIT